MTRRLQRDEAQGNMNAFFLAEVKALLLSHPKWSGHSVRLAEWSDNNMNGMLLSSPSGEELGDIWQGNSQWHVALYDNVEGGIYWDTPSSDSATGAMLNLLDELEDREARAKI